jgi:hypothetical protein
MAIKSTALVDPRFRARRNLHLAEWTAQVVLGVRALRHMVNVDASPSMPEDMLAFRSASQPRGLLGFDARETDRSSSPPSR